MIHFKNHAFKGLDDSLSGLFAHLNTMGEQVEALLALLPQGIREANPDIFVQAKAIDKNINAAEIETDKAVADILGKFNLIGEELRFLLGSIKVAAVLERLADRVKNCSKRLAKIEHPLDAEIAEALTSATQALKAMMRPSLEQLVDYKPETTVALLKHGADVQRAYRSIVLRLNQLALDGQYSHHLLLIAKNLDQASDSAIEIMKVGHYVCLGEKYQKESLND